MRYYQIWKTIKPVVLHVWPLLEQAVCEGIKELGKVMARI